MSILRVTIFLEGKAESFFLILYFERKLRAD
jgi:hypothetical protein